MNECLTCTQVRQIARSLWVVMETFRTWYADDLGQERTLSYFNETFQVAHFYCQVYVSIYIFHRSHKICVRNTVERSKRIWFFILGPILFQIGATKNLHWDKYYVYIKSNCIYIDKHGSCNAARTVCIWLYQWRPNLSSSSSRRFDSPQHVLNKKKVHT